VRDQLGTEVLGGGTGCIGTPAELRESLRTFQDAGMDQTIFIRCSRFIVDYCPNRL